MLIDLKQPKIWMAGGAVLLLLFLVASMFARLTQSSHPSEGRIAVINLDRIRTESLPFTKFKTYIEDKRSDAEQMIFNTNNELLQEHKELRQKEKKSSKQTEEVLAQKRDFEKKVAELEQVVQSRKNELNQLVDSVTSYIEAKLSDIIEQLCKDENIDIVINRSINEEVPIVIFAGKQMDITDKVIAKLNEATPQLNIPEE